MEILGLDHVQLAMPVGGEATARPFYENLLGLKEMPKPEPLRLFWQPPGIYPGR